MRGSFVERTIFMIRMRTELIHVTAKSNFCCNKEDIGYSSGQFEACTDNISRATAHGYRIFMDKKKRIKVNLSHDLSFSDISGNIFNVTSSTPFFNEVCIEPESTGGKSACV